MAKHSWIGVGIATGLFLLIALVLLAGLLPLAMPLGIAAGGVLETGQAVPQRWWLAALVAVALLLLLSWRMAWRARLWWLAVLAAGMASAVLLFCWRATEAMPVQPSLIVSAPAGSVGLVTALPLFWPEDATPGRIIAGKASRSPLVDLLHARPVDHIDIASLRGLDALVVAQPRLLQPKELVALDDWVRGGGRAVIFADPLLVWPSRLPLGDPRRPPLTSLLDPLLLHWGLRLEPVAQEGEGVERRMLGTGHVLIIAGVSHFSLIGGDAGANCALEERALMVLCRIARGQVRLVADADLLDDRLWLADPRRAERGEAWASDIVPLLDSWVADPLALPRQAAPRRIPSDAALISGLRWGLLAALFWAGLGGVGYVSRLRTKPLNSGADLPLSYNERGVAEGEKSQKTS